MPRYGGAGGLAQLRHESARDSVEAEGWLAPCRVRLANFGIEGRKSSVLGTTRDIWRRDGVRGFLHGNLSACVRTAVYSGVKLATWTSLRLFLEDTTGQV